MRPCARLKLCLGAGCLLGFDGLGDVLRPGAQGSAGAQAGPPSAALPSAAPLSPAPPLSAAGQAPPPAGKVLTGDLDSSLASLANNLTINKSAQQAVKWVLHKT